MPLSTLGWVQRGQINFLHCVDFGWTSVSCTLGKNGTTFWNGQESVGATLQPIGWIDSFKRVGWLLLRPFFGCPVAGFSGLSVHLHGMWGWVRLWNRQCCGVLLLTSLVPSIGLNMPGSRTCVFFFPHLYFPILPTSVYPTSQHVHAHTYTPMPLPQAALNLQTVQEMSGPLLWEKATRLPGIPWNLTLSISVPLTHLPYFPCHLLA